MILGLEFTHFFDAPKAVVGDHENGPKTNHAGAVEDVTMRKYLQEENVISSHGHNKNIS